MKRGWAPVVRTTCGTYCTLTNDEPTIYDTERAAQDDVSDLLCTLSEPDNDEWGVEYVEWNDGVLYALDPSNPDPLYGRMHEVNLP